ncbi:MAG TPA: PAS domain-containing protein, partial [Gemmatimonadaceae bacterium]
MPHATRNPKAAAQAGRIPNLFHELFEAVPALVVLTDQDGRIILFNAACEALTGYSRDEVIGRAIPELFLPTEWVPIVMQRFADPEASEVQLPHENPWITKSGERRMIEWRCATFRAPGASGPYVLGAGVDLTPRSDIERVAK